VTHDVVVLGLGAAGSATAMHLARRGQRVLGLEQHGPLHDRGSSHGETRVIRQSYFEHPDYVPLLLRAYELWRALERDSGSTLLVETGGLFLGRPDAEVVAGSLASSRQHGLAHELLDAREVRRRWPELRPRDDEVGLFEAVAGVLFAERCVQAHLDQAARAGAELCFGAKARLVSTAGPVVVEVTTGAGVRRVEAERVVITAGAWAPALLARPELPRPPRLEVERNWVAWLEPQGAAPGAFDAARFPVYVWERPGDVTPWAHYGIPAIGGDPPKAAFHHGGGLVDPDVPRQPPTAAEVQALRARLRDTIPALGAGQVAATTTCLYTVTSDGHFVVDALAGGRVVVGSACSGHGFKLSSVMGEALADLATAGHSALPIGFLRLDRPGLVRT